MKRSVIPALVPAAVLLWSATAMSAEREQEEGPERLDAAVEAGLAVLQRGTVNYEEHRTCFSCHHQTLPMLAQATAREHGFAIDEELFRQQARLTHEGFRHRTDRLRKGENIGGGSMTVAFALWALDVADWKRDEVTEAMVAYLLKVQRDDGRFHTSAKRPPLQDSPVTSAVISSYYLREFATDDQEEEAEASVAAARRWLAQCVPERQEDLNARLWGLELFGAGDEEIEAAQNAVLAAQRDEGGWAQLPEMASDAYATGQALWVLQESGLAPSHRAYQSGVRFLLKTQEEDGSWHVTTRSTPVQKYYESGFPHGKDQFISTAATSWAVAALAAAWESEEGSRGTDKALGNPATVK